MEARGRSKQIGEASRGRGEGEGKDKREATERMGARRRGRRKQA